MKVIEFVFPAAFEVTRTKAEAGLKEIGFGIITEIDMQATLKTKIDKDIEKYVILGACNPTFAYEALELDRNVGVFLPCNVVLTEVGEQQTKITIIDPVAMITPMHNEQLDGLGKDVYDKLIRLEKILEG